MGAVEEGNPAIDAGQEMVWRALVLEFPAELKRMPPACPSRVALALRVVDLAVLRQVRSQTECGVRARGVRKFHVWRPRGPAFDAALGDARATLRLQTPR